MVSLFFPLASIVTMPKGAAPSFTPEQAKELGAAFGFNVLGYEDADVQVRSMGNPVVNPVLLESATWTQKEGDTFRTYVSEEILIVIAMIDAQRAKYVEMTPMEGYDGTVKEYSAHGDYDVTIKGLLVSDNGQYPASLKAQLKSVEEAKVAVPVSCEYLNDLGILNLVILNLKWVPTAGSENSQAFEMQCVSDKDVQLKLNGGA